MNPSKIEIRKLSIIQEFEIFGTWSDKYLHIINLSKDLPEFPKNKKNEDNRIKGCQSKVWFCHETRGKKIIFFGLSDSSIVSGLVSILIRLYSNSYPQEIIEYPINFIKEIGLDKHISQHRNNSLYEIIKLIYNIANRYKNNSTL